jgi:nucleoside phosphorylase
MAKTINPEDYSIVWLCPLPVETAAALFMLDEHHEGVVNRQHGQTVEYHFGRIGRHNVAIAGFPSGEVGIGKAGTMAEAAVRDFKNLELGLLVGIGAAIPSQDRDIRLGDVAVADPTGNYPGIISYDMAKVVPGEERPKQWMEATHPLWRSVISKIRARATVQGDAFHRHLKIFETPKGKQFRQPYDPPPLHAAFENKSRDAEGPVVYYGTMLSGNKVIKAIEFRDQLKERFGDPVALEMEAAGVMTTLPVAVVRGISDAADHHKNDEWHARAAAVAAAYAKEMLLQLSPKPTLSKYPIFVRIAAPEYATTQTGASDKGFDC